MADEEALVVKVGTRAQLRESGAGKFLFFAIVMFASAVAGYVVRAVTYDIYVAVLAVGIAFTLTAVAEFRFYQIRKRLRNIEKMLRDIKEHQAKEAVV